jgi:hypothetical protein
MYIEQLPDNEAELTIRSETTRLSCLIVLV